MADKKKQYIKAVIGPGIAAYSYLAKPDEGGKYSDGKFKLTLVVDQDAPWLNDFKKKCLEAAKAEWPKAKPDSIKLPLIDGDEKEKEEFEGKFLITAKSQRRPKMVDAKRNALPKDVIKSGDEVKISVTLNPCTPSGTKTVALWLNGVQLIAKNNEGYDAADDFDEEDGFEYEGGEDAEDKGGDDEDDDDGDF